MGSHLDTVAAGRLQEHRIAQAQTPWAQRLSADETPLPRRAPLMTLWTGARAAASTLGARLRRRPTHGARASA